MCILKSTQTHAHMLYKCTLVPLCWTAWWVYAKICLAADSQGKAHLMPSHLPSVCWIIPFAFYTTGTDMNTPVKYKNTHTHTAKCIKFTGSSYTQLGEMHTSGWPILSYYLRLAKGHREDSVLTATCTEAVWEEWKETKYLPLGAHTDRKYCTLIREQVIQHKQHFFFFFLANRQQWLLLHSRSSS